MKNVIGREPEKKILLKALSSNQAALIVVYGRRRIGKTFLVRSVYRNHIRFEFSGIHNLGLNDQLTNFYLLLSKKLRNIEKPKSWIEAFFLLGQYFDRLTSKKKKVLFIDEFPWLDTRKSKFLPAFENFWNSYVTKRDDMVVVICGSAASYMVKNIISSKGGLHNRLTQKIRLQPFSLRETELLLKSNQVILTRYDIAQIYMALGGVPFYLEKIEKGDSVAQAIDRLCFSKHGVLRTEFDSVFVSLFDQHDNHYTIVRMLAKVRKGLTRNEILKESKVKSGGTLSKTLFELEESGFIEKYLPYQGKKDSLYRLTDEYSLFYLKFIEKSKTADSGSWMTIYGKQTYKAWSGFTFESTCIKHIKQIKYALKISGINSYHGSWVGKGTKTGAQIDLLIDRDDNVINLCEMKFVNSKFTIDKKYALELANKSNTFQLATKTRKNIFTTFITSYGLVDNKYRKQFVQNELVLDDLFM